MVHMICCTSVQYSLKHTVLVSVKLAIDTECVLEGISTPHGEFYLMFIGRGGTKLVKLFVRICL